jgi:hypothetical protein
MIVLTDINSLRQLAFVASTELAVSWVVAQEASLAAGR